MKKSTHRIFRFVLRLLLGLVARVEVQGFDDLPRNGGYIVAANHIGRLDAALAYYIIDRPDIIMVVAEKYEKYAFYRWLVRLTNGMFIDRNNSDIRGIRETLRRLREGQVFVITPEGTRSRTGNLLEAKAGAVFMAWKAEVPILPVALTGCEDAVVVQRLKRLQRLRIRVVAGEFFRLRGEVRGPEREALMKECSDEVMCRIATLLPAERRGVYAEHPRVRELG